MLWELVDRFLNGDWKTLGVIVSLIVALIVLAILHV